jgi:hypothetical protein
MNIKDILKINTSAFKAPTRFPAGNYVAVITSYDMLPFFWKKSGTHGLAYCPTIRCISCIEADDDSNPDLQAEQQAALDAFGDWSAKEFQFSYTSKETNVKMAAISAIISRLSRLMKGVKLSVFWKNKLGGFTCVIPTVSRVL